MRGGWFSGLATRRKAPHVVIVVDSIAIMLDGRPGRVRSTLPMLLSFFPPHSWSCSWSPMLLLVLLPHPLGLRSIATCFISQAQALHTPTTEGTGPALEAACHVIKVAAVVSLVLGSSGGGRALGHQVLVDRAAGSRFPIFCTLL